MTKERYAINIFTTLVVGVAIATLIYNIATGDEPTLYQYDGGVLLSKQKLSDTTISPNASDVYALWDGKGKWIKGGVDQEPPAQAILDMNEAKKPLNGGKKPIITQLKEKAQEQKLGIKIGDTVVEDKLRSGKVTKVTKDYVLIEVKIPLKEITEFEKWGRFPVTDLPRRKPDAIIKSYE